MDDLSRIAAAEAATNAVLEPTRRRFFSAARKAPPLTHCENCGAPLSGPYCAQCGQHAVDYRRSLARVLVDAADSFFNWDTKFLKSVGILLIKPWKLTNDFNAGRRVRYVHPLRLYLLASIAFFLIARLAHFNGSDVLQFDPKDRAELEQELAKLSAPGSSLDAEERAKVEAARARLSQMNGPVSAEEKQEMRRALTLVVTSRLKQELRPKDRARLSRALDQLGRPTPGPAAVAPEEAAAPVSPTLTPAPTSSPRAGLSVDLNDPHKEATYTLGDWIGKRLKEKIGEDGSKRQLFFDTLRSNIPTMMLCCIPLFAFVLKILYIRKRRFYVEHLVYALHIHSFAYLAVVVTALVAMALARWSSVAESLAIGLLSAAGVVLVFFSIRRVYAQGWFFTTFKFFLGGIVYWVILVTAVALTAFLTVLLPGN